MNSAGRDEDAGPLVREEEHDEGPHLQSELQEWIQRAHAAGPPVAPFPFAGP